jgi:hypothetical protein
MTITKSPARRIRSNNCIRAIGTFPITTANHGEYDFHTVRHWTAPKAAHRDEFERHPNV